MFLCSLSEPGHSIAARQSRLRSATVSVRGLAIPYRDPLGDFRDVQCGLGGPVVRSG